MILRNSLIINEHHITKENAVILFACFLSILLVFVLHAVVVSKISARSERRRLASMALADPVSFDLLMTSAKIDALVAGKKHPSRTRGKVTSLPSPVKPDFTVDGAVSFVGPRPDVGRLCAAIALFAGIHPTSGDRRRAFVSLCNPCHARNIQEGDILFNKSGVRFLWAGFSDCQSALNINLCTSVARVSSDFVIRFLDEQIRNGRIEYSVDSKGGMRIGNFISGGPERARDVAKRIQGGK